MVRDSWRQKDLEIFEGAFSVEVPARGVVFGGIAPAG